MLNLKISYLLSTRIHVSRTRGITMIIIVRMDRLENIGRQYDQSREIQSKITTTFFELLK